MRINLTVTAGPHTGKVYTFEEHDNFIVGRSKRAHFQLPVKDKYFSRIHFMVEVNPPQCRLMDMGSTNGTYVNGQRVDIIDLHDGDQIKAGQTVISVSVQGVPEPAPMATPAELLAAAPGTESSILEVVPVAEAEPEPARAREAERTPQPEPAPAKAASPPGTGSAFDSIDILEPAAVPGAPARVKEPAPPVKPPPPGATCRVCSVPLTIANVAAVPAAEAESGLPPLCRACWKQIEANDQPITGYLIVREVGRGAMGLVSMALRKSDGALVALKTIMPAVAGSRANVDRFFREASILRELEHPNIVAFREMGESNGKLFFAMDFVRGRDAAHLLKDNGGPLAIPRAVGLVCQLLEALEFAHAKGFVHRDIKPANMLVTEVNGREVAKLLDFGLARVYQTSQLSGLTMTGDLGGTVAFMAPEQITHYREAKPPVDQYAAGATLYNLLTNSFPYDLPRQVQHQILLVLQNPPVPIQTRRKDIPKPLADVIHRALLREPGERFGDVGAMRLALLPYCQ
jgi:serine/threonine-protein kinase